MLNFGSFARGFFNWRQTEAPPLRAMLSEFTGASEGLHQNDFDVLMIHLAPELSEKERLGVCTALSKELQRRTGLETFVLDSNCFGNFVGVTKGKSAEALKLLNSPAFLRPSLDTAMKAELFMEQMFAHVSEVLPCQLEQRLGVLLRFDPNKLPPDTLQRRQFISNASALIRQRLDCYSVSFYFVNDEIFVAPHETSKQTLSPDALYTILSKVVSDAHAIKPFPI